MHPDTNTADILQLEREKLGLERGKNALETERLAFEVKKAGFEAEKLARERWWHEDRLINERMTWLFTMQALIWGGYAFLRYRITEVAFHMTDRLPTDEKRYLDSLYELADWIRRIGMASALVIGVGIIAAVLAQRVLRRKFPDIEFGAHQLTTRLGYFTALFAAVLCFFAWLLTGTYLPTIDVTTPDHLELHKPDSTTNQSRSPVGTNTPP